MYNLLNIKAVASDKGITIKELIKRIKKTEQGFYKSLDSNSMSIKTLALIAEELGVTISELIADSSLSSGGKELKNSLVSESVTLYNPPKEEENLYKIMYEQQVELTKSQKRVSELELELERIKNGTAPAKDALAG